MIVISLYDYTGEAVRPWAEAGYECFCYDIQHEGFTTEQVNSGSIHYCKADLHDPESFKRLKKAFKDEPVKFGMGFPVCTDMAVSGAAWFKAKAEKDPEFQAKAVKYAIWCSHLFEVLEVPYFIENPISVLSTKWRKPDYKFHPYEYGGYIPDSQAEHPTYPEYIAPKDAYSKKTCLWVGKGFKMPPKKPVDCESFGTSRQHAKLGGKSLKTKNIRSATPRGFAKAIFKSNNQMEY